MAKACTPLQVATLRAVATGEVSERNYGYGAWRIVNANPSVVGRLASLGLVRWTKRPGGVAELTDEGRAAIAKATGADQ